MTSNNDFVSVYWNTVLCGEIRKINATTISFRYDATWIEKRLPAISFSLPVQSDWCAEDRSTNFFDNLLPEEDVRKSIARHEGFHQHDIFSFLKNKGQECAGALCIIPQNKSLSDYSNKGLEDITDKIASILTTRKKIIQEIKPLGIEIPTRISLAGAQDKLPVRIENGRMYVPHDLSPTTHIIKPDNNNFQGIVYNEFLCMRLASLSGLTVPQHNIIFVEDDIPLYVVERFDRKKQADGSITRIHQEDFCQALGINKDYKYQKAGWGFSYEDMVSLLFENNISNKEDAQIQFLESMVFNALVGNTDAHAKNFSILHKGNQATIAPLYDIVSSDIYSDIDSSLSIAIGTSYCRETLYRADWELFAKDLRLQKKVVFTKIEQVLQRIQHAQKEILQYIPENQQAHVVWDALNLVMQRNKELLEKSLCR
ncbi:MAG: HipA domain-containing protein [Pseudomonadota bacterium]